MQDFTRSKSSENKPYIQNKTWSKNIQWNIYTKNLLLTEIRLRHWTKHKLLCKKLSLKLSDKERRKPLDRTCCLKLLHFFCKNREPHSESGFHYHMCVKFSNNKCWYGAKLHLLANYNISVHFSDSHQNYISAYIYVTKEDTEVFQSWSPWPWFDKISSNCKSK